MAITVKEAQTLYVSYFGRPADFVGLQYWTGTETLVGSLEQLAHSFYNSAEGKKYFPVDPATNQVDVTASINAIYANMFGRVPETAGFDYWYNEIASGKINPAEAAVAIYRGAQGKDALMIENKIAAATQFTDQVAASNQPSLYYGDQAFAKANEFLNTVTDVTDVTSAGFAAQVNAAVNVAEAAGGASSSEGGIFTLTTDSAGNLLTTSGILTNEANVGFEVPADQSKYLTAGNDVVDLSKWNGSGSVNIGDAFSGDNDKVTVMAGALQKNSLKLTSIENLEIVNSNVKTSVALNGANFKGLEAIKLIGDDTTLDVSSFTQGVKIDATANADYILGSNKADTINGGAGNDTIIGSGGDDVLTGGNGADTFFVSNAKDFGVDQILDFSAEDKISLVNSTYEVRNLKKFDASTFSTVTYKTLDSVLATFRQDGANQTGTGDVVIFGYDGKTYALLADGAFDETRDALVDITGANVASLNESNFGATSATPPMPPIPQGTTYDNYEAFVNAVVSGTIPAGEQVSINTLTGPQAGELAVNKTYLDKIAADGIKHVTGNVAVTVGTTSGVSNNFNSADFETKLADGALGTNVMIINGSSVNDVIVTSFGGTINGNGGNDNIYVSGSGAVTINCGSGDDRIDASAATGAVSINGGAGADNIIGGASNDTIIAGVGADSITGGSGNDTITLAANTDGYIDTIIFEATAEANGVDTINNFRVGSTSGDKLDVSAFLGSGTTISVAAVTANATGSAGNVTSGTNVIKLTHTNDNTDVVKFAATGKYVVLYDADGASTNEKTKVYYYTATGNATDEIAVSTITAVGNLVATTDVEQVSGFEAANFA